MDINLINQDPDRYTFWLPEEGRNIHIGPEQTPVPLPDVPLPIKTKALDKGDSPDDHVIGEGVYDYLRQFPDCLHNTTYASLLRDGYAHYIADLAAHAVLLDNKDVEPAYVYRKLSCLKILCLIDPEKPGLLWQLSQGFYDLAMTFSELPRARRCLLESMRYGQALVKLEPENLAALNLLAEVDILFGDYPAAINRLRRMIDLTSDPEMTKTFERRLETCLATGVPDHCLVDDLEMIGDAMQLYAAGNYVLATEILERLEENAYFSSELKSDDFLCLLGMCRSKTGDQAGAFDALSQALAMNPDHVQARESLDAM